MKVLLPEGWERPSGYSNGIQTGDGHILVAGMAGWDKHQVFPKSFADQFELALVNTVAVLAAGGGAPKHIVRMTWFVKGLHHYRNNIADVGRAYRKVVGKNYPVMAVIGVSDLVEPEALIEIETTAVIEACWTQTCETAQKSNIRRS